MNQCRKCRRLLCNHVPQCIYCKNGESEPLKFEPPSITETTVIYTDEIVIDGQAYQIIKPLGRGGFGTVVEVHGTVENERFAMKAPLVFDEIFTNNRGNDPEKLEQSRKSIKKEIEMINRYCDETYLHFPRIGKVTPDSRTGHPPFPVILMELAEGTLDNLIQFEKKGGQLPGSEKDKIIKGIVNAVANLHEKGVLHRDLSPGNIFMVNRGKRISYVLGDFGASKKLHVPKDRRLTSVPVGQPYYFDPGRLVGGPGYNNDDRIDIFSLAVIISEIVIGKYWRDFFDDNVSFFTPFDFENEFLLEHGPAYIDKNLLQILCRAVKKDLEMRYFTIGDFRRDVFRVLGRDWTPDPVLTGPVDITEILRPVTKTIPFAFTLKLPYRKEKKTMQICHETYNISGNGQVALRNFRGGDIVIEDVKPRYVKIKGTSLYDGSIHGNAVRLNFNNKKFEEALRIIASIHDHLRGELHFKGIMEVSGIMETR